MATLVLSATGAALGGAVGGSIAGMSTAVIGRAVGASLGRVIDQKLLGQGSQKIEHGKVDRFRLSSASEGEPISGIYGRMRIGGQIIWASDFIETASTSGGGKGTPASSAKTTSYSYSVSLAIALCEGEITRVARIWADGEEVAIDDLNMHVYYGRADQLPDPTMEAIEGAGNVPAYRGTAYVVFEDLALEQFGNRVPQFSFEVARPEQPGAAQDLTRAIEAVAIVPGTGEYTLATTPVNYTSGPGSVWSANVNTPAGKTDFACSLDALSQELPNAQAASLVVSWFGNDLRCGECKLRPKIEKPENEGKNMNWQVAGLSRAEAEPMDLVDGNPVYGGTPTDQSVIEAIEALNEHGKAVMFYPFILMDQLEGNLLPDPYGGTEQARLPWRGRITLDIAPGQAGSPDGTSTADQQVAAFFGTARATDFSVSGKDVTYTGPEEWSFSRFILHYAALCAAAGGVQSFCIGSEMRGLTQIRGAGNSFPFVALLRQLAGDVRALLGHDTMIGYAADWSEYFGYSPQDGSGDRYFHLDPLWADNEIDFVGIDNYMPISDWRDGDDHADAGAGSIYDLGYLQGNIEGGEGYDWYYANEADAAAQLRTPIEDGAHGEPWVWRYKDIRNWWLNPHHDRIGGVKQAEPTAWEPQSKPIWFTEYGCAAVDKSTNQPNKFLDAKSSESQLPAFSNGARDELIQMQYLQAYNSYYAEPVNNPISDVYGGPMVDMSRAFVWSWDARPFPFFPNNRTLWSDGENFARGHWINGRTSARPLASVVEEICGKAGLSDIDTSKLFGYVRGYTVSNVDSARAALQPLMLRYGFDAVERDGVLHFVMRDRQDVVTLDPDMLARDGEIEGAAEYERESELEMSGRVRLQFVQADADYDAAAEEAVLPNEATHAVSTSELPLALTRGEGRQTAERWLAEARVARNRVRFALPPSAFNVGAGDVISLGTDARYRVDRVEQGALQIVDAVRMERSVYTPADVVDDAPPVRPFTPAVPVTPLFLDLPLMRGDEVAHAPHVVATASRWPGAVAVYRSATDSNYTLNTQLPTRSVMGQIRTPLLAAPHGVWDRAAQLDVALISGQLERAEDTAVFAGGNLAAIGDGTPGNWELVQFAEAELTEPGVYRVQRMLRGQQGTDGLIPDVWPAGSWFVLLNGAAQQIDFGSNLRQVDQHFRIGPAKRGYDDPSYQHLEHAFDGNGLRPYSPAHLRAHIGATGDTAISWIRRTRIEGDNWDGEVPLGEDSERYLLQVWADGGVVREVETTAPEWTYPDTLRQSDGVTGTVEFRVAQLSDRFGAGIASRVQVTL
ncbi:host specificity protein [Aliishimia ponticola]|uniref:Host specificity protein n=1 Tax=Aliishimia ponticola TaxID=2499833 RepID=A0A4S4NJ99_9RHOB|nr:glycoside hydrolase/phage tail family protein [Aliishimia ponticola]THH38318.1 host specificity protein [Aliishimia ponticola]